MSLLEAVQNVAEEAGYKVDSEVIGSTDVTTMQLRAMANRIVREMADKYAWPKLFKQGTITLATSTASYAKPADFSHYHFDTFWNQEVGWRVFGPLSPQDIAEIDGYNVDPSWQHFQIRGVTDTEITIKPTPGSGENGDVILFEYIADRAVRPRTWATGQAVVSGDYTFYNGIYYIASSSGTTGGAAPASDSGVTWTVYSGTYSKFLADTDEPVIKQSILEQGMLERFAEIKGLTVASRFAEQLNEEYSRQVVGRTLYADGGTSRRGQYAENGRVFFGS